MTSTTSSEADTENMSAVEYAPGGNPDWDKVHEARALKYAVIEALPLAGCTIEVTSKGCGVNSPQAPDEGYVAEDYHYPMAGAGSRLEKAWQILNPERPAKWKTVGMLRTLRQALRECDVQMMPLQIPDSDAAHSEVLAFLSITRVYDADHHGRATF